MSNTNLLLFCFYVSVNTSAGKPKKVLPEVVAQLVEIKSLNQFYLVLKQIEEVFELRVEDFALLCLT